MARFVLPLRNFFIVDSTTTHTSRPKHTRQAVAFFIRVTHKRHTVSCMPVLVSAAFLLRFVFCCFFFLVFLLFFFFFSRSLVVVVVWPFVSSQLVVVGVRCWCFFSFHFVPLFLRYMQINVESPLIVGCHRRRSVVTRMVIG